MSGGGIDFEFALQGFQLGLSGGPLRRRATLGTGGGGGPPARRPGAGGGGSGATPSTAQRPRRPPSRLSSADASPRPA